MNRLIILILLFTSITPSCVRTPEILDKALNSSFNHMKYVRSHPKLTCTIKNGKKRCFGNCVAYTKYHKKFLNENNITTVKEIICFVKSGGCHMILEVEMMNKLWYLDNIYLWPMTKQDLLDRGYTFR